MVDVGTRAGDAAIVKHAERVRKVAEALRKQLFTDGTLLPRAGALRVVGESENQPAELRMLSPDPFFATVTTSLMLTVC